MQKRLFSITLVLVISLFLFSCSGQTGAGETPMDTAAAAQLVQSGTQGVEINFLPNQPPALIYDQSELTMMLEVYNRGNYPLNPQDCFIQVTGFDQNIIKGMQTIHSCAETMDVLDGKNLYNTKGGYNMLEFRAPNVVLPYGVFEYNPTLKFVTCFNYHTTASPQVCVDPLFYQITSEQKNCLPKSVGMGGGQGGPVGVSYVGVNMIGRKAVFEISVTNYGTGRVISPNSDIKNCGQSSLDYMDLDKVAYNVKLSGGNLIDCKPRDRFVKLVGNSGKIVCTFDIPGTVAFETPMIIDLDYSYIQSQSKLIKVIKTPQ